jgi:hypothetical protein
MEMLDMADILEDMVVKKEDILEVEVNMVDIVG